MTRRELSKLPYGELLQTREYQKFKYRVLEDRNYECENPDCDDRSRAVYVHHGDYGKRGEILPWEYPLDTVYVACKPCHDLADEIRINAGRIVATVNPWILHRYGRDTRTGFP